LLALTRKLSNSNSWNPQQSRPLYTGGRLQLLDPHLPKWRPPTSSTGSMENGRAQVRFDPASRTASYPCRRAWRIIIPHASTLHLTISLRLEGYLLTRRSWPLVREGPPLNIVAIGCSSRSGFPHLPFNPPTRVSSSRFCLLQPFTSSDLPDSLTRFIWRRSLNANQL